VGAIMTPIADLISLVAAVIASIGVPATALEPAVRGEQTQLTPPPAVEVGIFGLPYAPPGLDDCVEMRFYLDQFGMPARFDSIGWRESNCRNEDGVRTSCCHGYLQLNANLHVRDHRLNGPYANCGVFGNNDINSDTPEDKQRHACAAKQLFDLLGYQPWSATR
jgi:hypothetical protein